MLNDEHWRVIAVSCPRGISTVFILWRCCGEGADEFFSSRSSSLLFSTGSAGNDVCIPVVTRVPLLDPQGSGGDGAGGSDDPLVQLVGVQAVRHGAGDGPPTAAGGVPLRPAVRRVRPPHHLLSRLIWSRLKLLMWGRVTAGIAVDCISGLAEAGDCPAQAADSWVTGAGPGMAGTVVAVCLGASLGRAGGKRRGSQTACVMGMGTNGVNQMMTICSFVDATQKDAGLLWLYLCPLSLSPAFSACSLVFRFFCAFHSLLFRAPSFRLLCPRWLLFSFAVDDNL